ncbi:YtxH domain-containing protein [Aquibacillus koreensis]|uniref:YtxH domain-containing protein n=1 Tax=Aquibacillus koreensis TaxID=279446 RepID=A0A9X3WL73_9BACI|nr:YtxH domain-containing protein [Aquibacillus koreensis]MCT2534438.1 YtxH domain-containing protein [Aquibacillus koreensis]MDC3421745.1 YtxH domain-containing protein [Aquibacillus koreensis]
MGSSKFLKGMMIGAAIGGLATLLDPDTRKAVGNRISNTGATVNYYRKHPSEGFHQLRDYYEQASTFLMQNVNSGIEVVNQIQSVMDTLDKESDEQTGTMETTKLIE